MANADWCHVSPLSGKGNGVLTISGDVYEGRLDRSTEVVIRNTLRREQSAKLIVKQKGKRIIKTLYNSAWVKSGETAKVQLWTNIHQEDFTISASGGANPDAFAKNICYTVNNGQRNSCYMGGGRMIMPFGSDIGATEAFLLSIELDFPTENYYKRNLRITIEGKDFAASFTWAND